MMRRVILADTGPLYAAVDPDDQYHHRAQEELDHLGRDGRSVAILYPTLLESYTLVLRRLGIQTAHRWLAEVFNTTELIEPTPEDYEVATDRVRVYADQPLTLFDVLLAVLGERLHIPIWTYDYHFDVMEAQVWYRESQE